MQIVLHLGAHKTATTYLQAYWRACSGSQGRNGVFAPELAEVRKSLTPGASLEKGEVDLGSASSYVNGLAENWRRAVLSDENLLGTSLGNFKAKALYPRASERLSRIADALRGHDVTVLLSVRAYRSYLSSSYCEVLRHTKFHPFAERIAGFDVSRRGWHDVIQDIVSIFGGGKILVWRYEDLLRVTPVLTAQLFNLPLDQLPDPPTTRFRSSFSQAAIDVATLLHGKIGAEPTSAVFGELTKVLPANRYPAFEPWSARECSALDAAYDQSLAKVAQMQRIEFWRPGVLATTSGEAKE